MAFTEVFSCFFLFSETANSREFKKTRFPTFAVRQTYENYRVFLRFRIFPVLFFYFPWQQTGVYSRKRLFSNVHRTMNFTKISCLPVFTGVFLYFLGQWVRVNSRKCLFASIHRSVNGWKIARISTFSPYSSVFQCSLTDIVRSLPPTIARPAGYQYSVD